MRSVVTTVLLIIFTFSPTGELASSDMPIREQEFTHIMRAVSDAWNKGNARKAADCFAEDAVYMEPPDRQVYVGRAAIYDFFGGPKKPEPPMHMTWHHLAFNEREQMGFGEFTFQLNHRYHGIVTVEIRRQKISKWREYEYQSTDDWETFAGKSKF